VARAMGRLPARLAGDSEIKLLALIMLMVALLSGLMSSTGTVAVMLPVVVGLAWDRGISPSRLLIPVSVASLLGGMLTLIGTAPNLVVSSHLAAMGREPFGFFSFTPVGLAMVTVGVAFVLVAGRRLLPDRPAPHSEARSRATTSLRELTQEYGLASTLFTLRVEPGSRLTGRSLGEAQLRSRYGVTAVDLRAPAAEREHRGALGALTDHGDHVRPMVPDTRFEPGDVMQVHGPRAAVAELVAGEGLTMLPAPEGPGGEHLPPEAGLVEALLTPRSRLIGRSLRESAFRERYRVTVLSVRRMGRRLDGDIREEKLRFGDTLLVKGPWENIRLLQRERRDFVVAGEPAEMDEALRPLDRAPLAVGIMLGMMGLLTLGVIPAVHAVLLAAVAMVLSGCVTGHDAYRSVNWESVVLIAAILPMATALEKTGGMAFIVQGLGGWLGAAGPLVMLGGLIALTSALSQVISNTATTVLLAPVAFQLAVSMDAAPEPFMMGIAVAASTAFATPIASPVNTLVLGPGGYRFGDFFRVGVPIQLLLLLTTLVVVPLLFPF
jgi:di/tricarboxylate transporter